MVEVRSGFRKSGGAHGRGKIITKKCAKARREETDRQTDRREE